MILEAIAYLALFAALGLLAILAFDCITFRPHSPAVKKRRGLGNERWAASKLMGEIDTIVIGSGPGGLTAAATLSQFGQRVAVFEQHEVLGGGSHSFLVEGKSKWSFDAGHHLTLPLHEQMLQLACGASHPPVRVPRVADADGASDRIVIGGDGKLEWLPVGSFKELHRTLIARFPRHKAAIDGYMALAESVQIRFALSVAAAVFPMGLRLRLLASPIMALWRLWAGKTTEEGLREVLPGRDAESNRLRSFVSGLWIDSGSPPSRMSYWMQAAVFGGFQKVGVGYPRGGPQLLAAEMVEAIEARGGAVFVRAPVQRIVLDRAGRASGIELQDGTVVSAARVVSGAGFRATASLLPADVSRACRPLDTKQSDGFVMANVGLEGSAEELGISRSSTWLQPASADNEYDSFAGIDAFQADPLGVPARMVPMGITFPSMKDTQPRAEPLRHHTCQILVSAPYKWFAAHMADDADEHGVTAHSKGARHAPPHVTRRDERKYAELKAAWGERLTSVLHDLFPGTAGRVAFVDVSTPLTIENYLRSGGGAGVGLDVTPARFVDAKEVAQLDAKFAGVPGLWLAGQDSLMCGQIIAAASGLITALRILGPLRMLQFGVRAARLLLSPLIHELIFARAKAA